MAKRARGARRSYRRHPRLLSARHGPNAYAMLMLCSYAPQVNSLVAEVEEKLKAVDLLAKQNEVLQENQRTLERAIAARDEALKALEAERARARAPTAAGARREAAARRRSQAAAARCWSLMRRT